MSRRNCSSSSCTSTGRSAASSGSATSSRPYMAPASAMAASHPWPSFWRRFLSRRSQRFARSVARRAACLNPSGCSTYSRQCSPASPIPTSTASASSRRVCVDSTQPSPQSALSRRSTSRPTASVSSVKTRSSRKLTFTPPNGRPPCLSQETRQPAGIGCAPSSERAATCGRGNSCSAASSWSPRLAPGRRRLRRTALTRRPSQPGRLRFHVHPASLRRAGRQECRGRPLAGATRQRRFSMPTAFH
jgi:hypothetical protein